VAEGMTVTCPVVPVGVKFTPVQLVALDDPQLRREMSPAVMEAGSAERMTGTFDVTLTGLLSAIKVLKFS
jgi:hypothetical protein